MRSRKSRTMTVLLLLILFHSAVRAAQDEAATTETSFTPLAPVGEISLPDALELALERHPRLEAFGWELRASDGRILQAGLRPNPELELEIEDIRLGDSPGTNASASSVGAALPFTSLPVLAMERESERASSSLFGETEITLTVSQLIELGGKRAKRVAAAEQEKAVVQWDYEVARADILAGVSAAFADVLVAQASVSAQEELLHLAQDIARTIDLRVEAGKVSPLESNKAAIALASAELNVAKAQRDNATARIALASWWGETGAHFERVAGDLEEVTAPPSREMVLSEVDSNPDVARWAAEFALREANLDVERSRRIVDPVLVAGLKSSGLGSASTRGFGIGFDGAFSASRGSSSADSDRDYTFVVGVSVPLPIFDRNQGNIAAAEAMASKASAERREALESVASALASAVEQMASAYDAVQSLDKKVIPQAEVTLDKTRRGYQEGKFAYLDVLDAQRTLFEARIARLDELARYHRERTQIERLTGRELLQRVSTIETTEE